MKSGRMIAIGGASLELRIQNSNSICLLVTSWPRANPANDPQIIARSVEPIAIIKLFVKVF